MAEDGAKSSRLRNDPNRLFALVGNRYHLLIETPEANQVRGNNMVSDDLHAASQRTTPLQREDG